MMQALEMADKVIMLVGSANQPVSLRNPFNFTARQHVIRQALPKYKDRIVISPLNDYTYDDAGWIANTQRVIRQSVLDNAPGNTMFHHNNGMADVKIGLIGCAKDSTSYYLKLFPQFGSENVTQVNPEKMLNATDIREGLYNDNKQVYHHVPIKCGSALHALTQKLSFLELKKEYHWTKKYKETVKQFPRIEHTVDAVVVESGHVLLVRRGQMPGKGRLALPGGFVDGGETLKNASIRELKEETTISYSEEVLASKVVSSETYDDPHRSSRGRIITTAYLFNLGNNQLLTSVKGADDAEEALWVPLADLQACDLYDDHFFIINDLIKRLPND